MMSGSEREMLDLITALKRELTDLYEQGAALTDPQLLEHSDRIDHLIVDWCRQYCAADAS